MDCYNAPLYTTILLYSKAGVGITSTLMSGGTEKYSNNNVQTIDKQ